MILAPPIKVENVLFLKFYFHVCHIFIFLVVIPLKLMIIGPNPLPFVLERTHIYRVSQQMQKATHFRIVHTILSKQCSMLNKYLL